MKFVVAICLSLCVLASAVEDQQQAQGQCNGQGQCSGQGQVVYDTPKYDIQYGDVQNCPQIDKKLVLEPLPGEGWDNLRNVGMGTVLMLNYSNCRMTSDRKFLIPDDATVQALKESNVHVYSSLVSHFSNYTSMTSRTINVEAHAAFHVFSISGSFSDQHINTKMQITGDKSVTSRSELRFRQYAVRIQPDAQPHPVFRDRVLDIASFVQANDSAHARYLADLLVRDYGTHYVSTVDAGALIAQEDQLNSSYVKRMDGDTTIIKASASASFMGLFGGGISYTSVASEEQINEYAQSRLDTHVYTYGGPPFEANFTINKWLAGIDNNLVTIDRNGEPLYYVLTSRAFPMIPLDTLRDVSTVVESSVLSYYRHNTYRGCTSVDSPNFNYSANLDDGSCRKPPTNHTFGGVYQSCNGSLCKAAWTLRNPKTGNSSCASGYAPVLMHTESHRHKDCKKKCHNVVGIHYKCKHKCKWVNDAVHIESYWCAANGTVAQDSGYPFGGVYTDTTANPLTNDKSCPENYVALRLGMDSGMYVCVSDEDELGYYRYSVPFGGFFSCQAGNPLALRHDITALQVGYMIYASLCYELKF